MTHKEDNININNNKQPINNNINKLMLQLYDSTYQIRKPISIEIYPVIVGQVYFFSV